MTGPEDRRPARSSPLLPDGGPPTTADDLEPGGLARDRDGRGELVVVEVMEAVARDVRVPEKDATVAELNPGWPGDARLARCVYLSSLEPIATSPDDVEALRDAVANGAVDSYTFPIPRLRPVDEGAAPDVLGGGGR